MRLVLTSLVLVLFSVGRTLRQSGTLNAEDVQKGHDLAIYICAICHLAAPDQPGKPIMYTSSAVICVAGARN
jgi:hypothetical protein